MLWLKARSLMALGMTTATRNGSPDATSVAGGCVAAGAPHALRTNARESIRVKNQTDFFIFFSLKMGISIHE
jgi:hypothetical protein